MRFHGLMMLRDEEDILAQCLDHLLSWIDGLYIIDLGSTDKSWEIVQDYARRDKRIVPFKRQPIVYTDNLRCVLFNEYRSRFEPGDWIHKIDADEWYHMTPPQFVRERLSPGESAVHLMWYFFRLTTPEVAAYESGQVDIQADRARPISERRRMYYIPSYAEPRMFRYRRNMQWTETSSFPFNAGLVARARLPIRHYPHRDPLQMAARFRLRAAMMRYNAHAGSHWKLDDWRQEIVDPQNVRGGTGSRQGLASYSPLAIQELHEWKAGTELPDPGLTNHLPKPGKRLMQRLYYATMAGLMDRRRPKFNPAYWPQTIPEEVNDTMTSGIQA